MFFLKSHLTCVKNQTLLSSLRTHTRSDCVLSCCVTYFPVPDLRGGACWTRGLRGYHLQQWRKHGGGCLTDISCHIPVKWEAECGPVYKPQSPLPSSPFPPDSKAFCSQMLYHWAVPPSKAFWSSAISWWVQYPKKSSLGTSYVQTITFVFDFLKKMSSQLLKLSNLFDIRQMDLTNITVLREICRQQTINWNIDC